MHQHGCNQLSPTTSIKILQQWLQPVLSLGCIPLRQIQFMCPLLIPDHRVLLEPLGVKLGLLVFGDSLLITNRNSCFLLVVLMLIILLLEKIVHLQIHFNRLTPSKQLNHLANQLSALLLNPHSLACLLADHP